MPAEVTVEPFDKGLDCVLDVVVGRGHPQRGAGAAEPAPMPTPTPSPPAMASMVEVSAAVTITSPLLVGRDRAVALDIGVHVCY